MATTTQRLIRLRAVHGHQPHPLRRFSSSSDTGPPSEPKLEPEPQSQPTFSSYFTDVKASLQNEPPPQNRPQTLRKPNPFPSPPPQTPPPSRFAYLDEILRNLSEFRNRSAPVPQPPAASSGSSVSLQELYNKHAPPNNQDSSGLKPPIGHSIGPIRDSLRQLRTPLASRQTDPQSKTVDPLSLAQFKDSLKLKPGENADNESSINGGVGLPPLFQKEMNKSGNDVDTRRKQQRFRLGTTVGASRPTRRKRSPAGGGSTTGCV